MASRLFKTILAIALAAVIALVALYAVKIVAIPPAGFFPPSFVTHSVMLVLSIAAMWLLSMGRLERYGLSKATYKFNPRILAWVLPTAVLAIISAFASPAGQGTDVSGDLTKPQIIVFVWIYASICEEFLTRGLLQTLLAGNSQGKIPAPHGLSMPVLVSGLFFGCMHIVLVQSMGPSAIPVILLAVFLGLIAARYREKTGSLLPAIITHALFNIGGTLPLWIIQWLHS